MNNKNVHNIKLWKKNSPIANYVPCKEVAFVNFSKFDGWGQVAGTQGDKVVCVCVSLTLDKIHNFPYLWQFFFFFGHQQFYSWVGNKKAQVFYMFVFICWRKQPKVTGLTNAVNKTCLLTITGTCWPIYQHDWIE